MHLLEMLVFSIVAGVFLGIGWRIIDSWWEKRK